MKIAVLFPGQGVQQKEMGKWLYEKFEVSRRVFEEASDCLGTDVARICFEGGEELNQTRITQPAVLTASVAAARAVREELGLSFQYGAGHSLGEYSALTVAGGLEFSDAVRVVSLRGQFMQEAVAEGKGAMCAINGCDLSTIEQILEQFRHEDRQLEISNYNSPYQTVVSGLEEHIKKLEKMLAKLQINAIRLKVSAPFHCSLMKPAQEKLEEVLNGITIHPLEFPVISNVTGVPYYSAGHIKECLTEQLTRAVEWQKSMQFLYTSRIDMVIDMGPGEVVKNLMKRNYPTTRSLSVDRDWSELSKIRDSKKEEHNAY